ncbi:hypothetical protein FQZ97_213020 [compost metagenome]
MAADQLAGDGIHHAGELEAPLLLRQLAVIHHLEQQVAKFTGQMVEVATLDGVGHLVGFLDRVRNDAGVVLLQVPGAAILRVAQPGHQVQQVVELVHVSSVLIVQAQPVG